MNRYFNAPSISKGTRCVFVFPPGAGQRPGDYLGTKFYADIGRSTMGAFWSLHEMYGLLAPEITEAEAREILGDKFPESFASRDEVSAPRSPIEADATLYARIRRASPDATTAGRTFVNS